MSPSPQLTAVVLRLTKKSPFPRIGVGQKSSAVEFTGSPRFTGAPHGAPTLARLATQMSRSVLVSPAKRGRVVAMYRLSPSGDWIGQPSWNVVFSSELLPAISSIFCAGAHGEKCIAWAAAASAVRLVSAATNATFIPFRILTPFPTCSSPESAAHVLVGSHEARKRLPTGLLWRQASAPGGCLPA